MSSPSHWRCQAGLWIQETSKPEAFGTQWSWHLTLSVLGCANVWGYLSNGGVMSMQINVTLLQSASFASKWNPIFRTICNIQYIGRLVLALLRHFSSVWCVCVCVSFDMPACQALPDSDILHRWFHRLSRMFWWGGSMIIWWSMETAVDLSPSASPLILRTPCWFHGRPFWACWRRCPRDWWRWFLDSLKGAYYIHTYLYALHSYLWQFAAFQKETQINVNLNESDGKS